MCNKDNFYKTGIAKNAIGYLQHFFDQNSSQKAYSEINYLKLFKIYYETRTESKHKIEINGKEIKLSDKTKFFDELLNKYNDNKIMQKLLINYTEEAYFSSEENKEKVFFAFCAPKFGFSLHFL